MLDVLLVFRLGGFGVAVALVGGDGAFRAGAYSDKRFIIAIGLLRRWGGGELRRADGGGLESTLVECECVPFGRDGSWWEDGDLTSPAGAGWACEGGDD